MASSSRSRSSSSGEGVEDLTDRELPVARTGERGLDRVDLAGAAQAATLPQHDGLGILRAGLTVGLLDDVDAQAEPGRLLDGRVLGHRPRLDGLRDRLLHGVRMVEQLVDPLQGRAAPAQVDPAEADALDALLVEPPQPRVVRLEVAGSAVPAGVLEPELDVRRGVEHVALDDEGVAVVREPAPDTFVPGPVPVDRPVGDDVAPSAVAQVVRRLADDRLDDLVAGQARVAVDQPVALTVGGG